jgi:beta-lactamase regulating signal transducer with metallopeptidase domain
MNGYFMTILTLSLSASVIALLMLLAKPLYRKKLSERWQYYIWLVVIARLSIPYSPDINTIGIFSKPAAIFVGQGYTEPATIPSKSFIDMRTVWDAGIPVGDQQISENMHNITPVSLWMGIKSHLWAIWLTVALILFLRKIFAYIIYVRRLKNGLTPINQETINRAFKDACNRLKILRPPPLYASLDVSAPMLVGLIKPFLVIPDCIHLSGQEMEMVLSHELVHFARRDIAYKWIFQIALCVHWFNPLLYIVKREISESCELSCDEAVLMLLKREEKYAYGDALLKIAKESMSRITPITAISASLSSEGHYLKKRLEAILKTNNKTKKVIIISAVLTVTLISGSVFLGSYFNARVNADSEPATGNPVMNNDNLYDAAESHTITAPDAFEPETNLTPGTMDSDINPTSETTEQGVMSIPDATVSDATASDAAASGTNTPNQPTADEELQLIYNYVDNSPYEADVGTRDMTSDELYRFHTMNRKYITDGLRPQKSLPFGNETGAEFWLDLQAAIYHYPDRELTDEELLQYIDWGERVNAALVLRTPYNYVEEPAPESAISEGEAVKAAAEFLNKAYNVDLSDFIPDVHFSQINGDTTGEESFGDPLGHYNVMYGSDINLVIDVGTIYSAYVGASDGFVYRAYMVNAPLPDKVYMDETEEKNVTADAAWIDAAKQTVKKLHGDQAIAGIWADVGGDLNPKKYQGNWYVRVHITVDDDTSYVLRMLYPDMTLREISVNTGE